MNTSMDDAGRCLLSVAWNIRSSFSRDAPHSVVDRQERIRENLRDVCRSAGHGACDWAVRHGPGTETDYAPFLRLADLSYEIDTLLTLVGRALVPDPEREARRWAEIDLLVTRADVLAEGTAVFLRAPMAVRC
ncbi:hypothetical protein [Amycolatopsis sp. PS_44_ISF1]|uniref:hypothetical protein n=1 Tax=Amycolatopsis sp. PS_44_ISF1 TaxID=2974917 RepID=UPI0028DDCDD5|nr:hypothetical protein [Amycolatopsis sp. PS_44_ISF1]MDT8915443.1 hypothetical protein [Amycolatopsis sp. PS_44_ISF1]